MYYAYTSSFSVALHIAYVAFLYNVHTKNLSNKHIEQIIMIQKRNRIFKQTSHFNRKMTNISNRNEISDSSSRQTFLYVERLWFVVTLYTGNLYA